MENEKSGWSVELVVDQGHQGHDTPAGPEFDADIVILVPTALIASLSRGALARESIIVPRPHRLREAKRAMGTRKGNQVT